MNEVNYELKNNKKLLIILVIILGLTTSFLLTYEVVYRKKNNNKNNIDKEQYTYVQPLLYLYPKKETKITISFEDPKKITNAYPKYKEKWKITAKPKGDLEDKDKNGYIALTWEEDCKSDIDFNKGYFVTKDESMQFLEDKLKYIGLNDKERNEFIISWLPVLVKNEKSMVYFELTEDRNIDNKLNISPKPDSMLRFIMHVKKVDGKPSDFEQQKLSHFNRKGFSVIECSGVLHT